MNNETNNSAEIVNETLNSEVSNETMTEAPKAKRTKKAKTEAPEVKRPLSDRDAFNNRKSATRSSTINEVILKATKALTCKEIEIAANKLSEKRKTGAILAVRRHLDYLLEAQKIEVTNGRYHVSKSMCKVLNKDYTALVKSAKSDETTNEASE